MMNSRLAIFTTSLFVLPLAGAMAQGNPSATPTKMSQPSTSSAQNSSRETGPATNKHVEGATGRKIVPGNESTIAGDRKATREEKTGSFNSR